MEFSQLVEHINLVRILQPQLAHASQLKEVILSYLETLSKLVTLLVEHWLGCKSKAMGTSCIISSSQDLGLALTCIF